MRKHRRVGRAAPVFAQLESEKAKEASDWQRGKLSPALEAWTGLAGPNWGQTHGLDGWKRTGGSRASVFKGCVPQRPWLCERWAF